MKLVTDFFNFIASVIAFGLDFFREHYEAGLAVISIFLVAMYLIANHSGRNREKNRIPPWYEL